MKKKIKPHTLKWFINRIGKKVYRDDIECCNQCKNVADHGLEIHDKNHAEYLFMVQNDLQINYRDRK